MDKHHFTVLPGAWTILQLPADAPIPEWALSAAGFISITRTAEELSIVCQQALAPAEAVQSAGWAVLKIVGPFDLTTTIGVLAALSEVLARAGVSLFALSTYNTDYLLVQQAQRAAAVAALKAAGHMQVE